MAHHYCAPAISCDAYFMTVLEREERHVNVSPVGCSQSFGRSSQLGVANVSLYQHAIHAGK